MPEKYDRKRLDAGARRAYDDTENEQAEGMIVGRVLFKVERRFCGECSLAIRRFIGGMDGVSAVDVENGTVVVEFNEGRLEEEQVRRLTRDSIERLGYRVEEG